jgi:hypothetical protein
MRNNYSIDDLILNYDPESPQERFRQAGLPAAMKSSTGRLPGPVRWPQGRAPTAAPLPQPPAESDDLGRFRGYDAVVLTWTGMPSGARSPRQRARSRPGPSSTRASTVSEPATIRAMLQFRDANTNTQQF